MSKVKKILVYGKTERQARKRYSAKAGETVGYRSIEDYPSDEKADDVVFVCEKPKTKSKKK